MSKRANQSSRAQEVWPVLRLAGHLPGLSRRDVLSYLKGHVERHFPEHVNERTTVSLVQHQEGWLFELCLGGDGRSRVEGIRTFLEEAKEGDRLVLPAAHRFSEISLTTSGRVTCRLLPEDDTQEYTDLPPGRRAASLYPSYDNALLAGGITLLVGSAAMALALSLVLGSSAMERSLAIDAMHQDMAETLVQQYENSPAKQFDENELVQTPGRYEYIREMRFDGKSWSTTIGCSGSQCESDSEDDS